MKKKIIIVLSIVIFIGLIIGGVIYFLKIKKSELQKIVNEVSKIVIYDSIEYSKEDTEFKYSYKEAVDFKNSEVSERNDKNAVSISKYNSNKEANAKLNLYLKIYDYYTKKLNGSLYEAISDYYEYFLKEKDAYFVVGNYLVHIDPKYNKKHLDLKEDITNIIKKYKSSDNSNASTEELEKYWNEQYEKKTKDIDKEYDDFVKNAKQELLKLTDDIDKCVGSDCDDYLDEIKELEKYDEIKDEVKKLRDKYDEVIERKKSVVNSINEKISKLEKSLNQEDYDSIKKEIEKIEDSYYNSYKTEWNKKLSNIEKSVFKKSCNNYSYKDLLRNPSDYQGKNAYFFGEIVQKIGSSDYRVNVNCKKYSFSNDYYCDDTIYMTYSGDVNLIEDDMVKVWGTMNGTQTYETVLGAEVTIPRFTAKYAEIQ